MRSHREFNPAAQLRVTLRLTLALALVLALVLGLRRWHLGHVGGAPEASHELDQRGAVEAAVPGSGEEGVDKVELLLPGAASAGLAIVAGAQAGAEARDELAEVDGARPVPVQLPKDAPQYLCPMAAGWRRGRWGVPCDSAANAVAALTSIGAIAFLGQRQSLGNGTAVTGWRQLCLGSAPPPLARALCPPLRGGSSQRLL